MKRTPALLAVAAILLFGTTGCLNIPNGEKEDLDAAVDAADLGSISEIICEESGGPDVFAVGSTSPYWRDIHLSGEGHSDEVRAALEAAGFYIPDGATNNDTLYTQDDVQVDIRSYSPGEESGAGEHDCSSTPDEGKTTAFFSKF